MKTRLITILAATALAIAALAFAGCDRSIDDINPEPISQGATGPGTVWLTLGGAVPIIEEPEDTTSGGDEDTVIGEDIPDVGDASEDVACQGDEVFCNCLAEKGNNADYTEYCNCMSASTVRGMDNETYCGCCYFGYDDSFPEYDGSEGSDEAWSFLVVGTCDPQEFYPPCHYDD